MAAATENKTEILAALEARVEELRASRDQVNRDRGRAMGNLRGASSRRLALEEARAAGEAVTDEEIADAVGAVEAAREDGEEAVWNARLVGIDRAIEQAEIDRDEFGRRAFAEIAAEETKLDGPARDALVEAWDALQQAAGAYALRARRWHHLAAYGSIPEEAIPSGTPLNGKDPAEVARRFEVGLEIPTPRTLRSN